MGMRVVFATGKPLGDSAQQAKRARLFGHMLGRSRLGAALHLGLHHRREILDARHPGFGNIGRSLRRALLDRGLRRRLRRTDRFGLRCQHFHARGFPRVD